MTEYNNIYICSVVVDAEPQRKFMGILSDPTFNFTSGYYDQNFSFSNSIIYYITNFPSNAKSYQKLIQTCKYFFNKNPIIILRCLHYKKVETRYKPYFKYCWVTCLAGRCDKGYEVRINESGNKKLWITDKIDMYKCLGFDPTHLVIDAAYSSLLKNLILKLHQCDAFECYFYSQTLNFDQFLFYASKAKKCDLCLMTIKNAKNDDEIPLETIMANLLQLEQFQFDINDDSTNISLYTSENLLRIPHFSRIKVFIIYEIPDSFDYHALKDYANKNKSVSFEFEHRRKFETSQHKISGKIVDSREKIRLYMRSLEAEWRQKESKL